MGALIAVLVVSACDASIDTPAPVPTVPTARTAPTDPSGLTLGVLGNNQPAAGCPRPTGLGGGTIQPAGVVGPTAHFVPASGLKRTDLAAFYQVQPLYDQLGLDGSGVTVAVASWDTFNDADIAAFDADTGTLGPPVEHVRFPDAAQTPGEGTDEVVLDTETIRTLAPKAQILDYETCGASFGDMVKRILDDGRAQIISISWGTCELDRTAGSQQFDWPSMAEDDIQYRRAAAAGVSIFVATGDDGAYDCRRNPARAGQGRVRDFRVSTDYPSTSPSVTAVGGTHLSVGIDSSYVSEAGWEDPLGQAGGGGGVSSVFARPDWQVGMGTQTDAGGMRQTPDIAGPADADSGIFLVSALPGCDPTQPSCRTEWTGGGTSQATPFWSGIAALATQRAQQLSLGPLGQLAPRLYRLANSAAYADLFHDVTRGGNLLQPAVVGWDYSTGWGTPQANALVLALMDDLRANPTVVSGT